MVHLLTTAKTPALIRTLRSVARALSDRTGSAEYLAPIRSVFAQNSRAKAIRRRPLRFAKTGNLRIRTTMRMRLPRPFAQMAPPHRIMLLRSEAWIPRVLSRYIHDATHANLLNQANGSFRGAASSFRRYTDFCDIRRIMPFRQRKKHPPMEKLVQSDS